MKHGYVHLIVLLDKSGSMQMVYEDAIGGFNSFLEKQKAEPGEATMTLVQFDDLFESSYSFTPLPQVVPLTKQTYVPRGSTRLRDALGKLIVQEGATLAAMREEDRPASVLVLVISDGQENASVEYTPQQIEAMIKTQKEVYSWTFTFIGSDEKGLAQVKHMGMDPGNIALFSADAAGTQEAFNKMSAGASSYRTRARGMSAGASLKTSNFYDADAKDNDQDNN